ncbi:MAG: oligosaccharide flippase family protein [Candidatus Shapirobacteria bacterium]
MKKEIIKNTAVQLFGRGLIILFGLIATALLTRFLGVAAYGEYSFLLAFFLFLVTLADWGTPYIGVREICRQKKEEKAKLVFTNLTILRAYFLALALLLAGGAIIILPLFSNLKVLAFILLPALVFTSFQTSFSLVFQAQLSFFWQTLAEVLNSGLFLLFLFLALAKNLGLPGAVWALAGSRLVSFLTLFVKGKKYFLGWSLKKKETLKLLAKESLPAGALLFLSTAYDRLVDTSFLRYYWGSSAVGIYGLSYKLYSNLILPIYFLSRSLFPLFSQRKEGKKQKAAFRLGISWALLSAFLILLAGYLFAPLVIFLLGGADFSASSLLLRLLLFSLPFTYLNHIFGFQLIAQGYQRVSLKIGLFSLAWNLSLNWWAIPRYSALGAAGVTVSTEIVVCLLHFLFSFKNLFGHRKRHASWYNKANGQKRK